jgi:hypothetical protein
MAHDQIILDVSGRKFRTQKSVLSVSPYFEHLFERWQDSADLQADGSFYADADADTFEHLLNFMRRPSRFPLYWTKKDGFDYALYCRVEAEADYFMLEGLRDWIKQQKYLKVVATVSRTHNVEGHQYLEGDFAIERYIVRKAGDVLCPFGINHDCFFNGDCKRARANNGLEKSDPKDEVLVVVTEFIFNNEILVNDTL